MIYFILYGVAGLIFIAWIACETGGWKESRFGRFGWILGFFLWPLFLIGMFIDWMLEDDETKYDGGLNDD